LAILWYGDGEVESSSYPRVDVNYTSELQ